MRSAAWLSPSTKNRFDHVSFALYLGPRLVTGKLSHVVTGNDFLRMGNMML